ncbi:MAG: hypothetical protein AMXMBFR64_54940 [Myxococcales bacterium]
MVPFSRLSTPLRIAAIAAVGLVASAAGLTGCAAMIDDAGRGAVTVANRQALAPASRTAVMQATCTGECSPGVVDATTNRVTDLFVRSCWDVVDAPELRPGTAGMAFTLPGGKKMGMDMGLGGFTASTPDGDTIGIGILFPPGVSDAIAADAAKKRGIRSLVSSSISVGEPDSYSGFRTGRVSFTVVDLDTRSTVLRGSFSGVLNDLSNGDSAVSGLFMVLDSGMRQNATLCQGP